MPHAQAGAGPFPLPTIPIPHPPRSRSRRLWQRHRRSTVRIITANLCIAALNALFMSFASVYTRTPLFSLLACALRSPHSLPVLSNPQSEARIFDNESPAFVSACQSRLLAHIFSCATRLCCRPDALPASECGDDSDANLSLHDLVSDVNSYLSRMSSAIPLVASRVALPSSVGSVPLLELLPPAIAADYRTESPTLVAALPSSRRRRARVFGSRREYVLLIRRMAAVGMVGYTRRPRAVNGVFGVPKGDGAIRLIIDARPANDAFVEPPHVELPTPDLLARMAVAADRTLFIAKVDLDNFYHRLRLPDWLCQWFALPAVRAADVGVAGDGWVYPCCTTLPMGWSHSVYLAQQAHEHFIATHTRFDSRDSITATTDNRLDRTRHQVYIDDLILVGPDREQLGQQQDDYIDAAERRGLVVKRTKVVRPTTRAECLGLELDGVSHAFGLSANKLNRLCHDTRALADRDTCTGLELSQVVGRWTWACLVRRPALSTFSAVYRFIERAAYRQFAVWPSVKRELLVMLGLAPLLWTSLSLPWFSDVVATDASSYGSGVVAAAASEALVASASTAERPLDCFREQRWRTIISSAWEQPEHINVLELRAVGSALRWVLSRPSSVESRLLVLCDSQVVVGAVNKGRSSSQDLLRCLRGVGALVLASGVQLAVRWIQSADNPADEPSRGIFCGRRA